MQPESPPPKQAKIHRSQGTTTSERLLADLGEQAFLDLWSYPNLFYDKKQGGKGDGKELCDMLVVCGDDVIIFSDKAAAWPEMDDIKVAWPRYYRKAIEGAVKQINGANRWLTEFPHKVYTDASCAQRLPIALPSTVTRRTHGVVVAGGAYKAVQTHLHDDSGSFYILPSLKGEEHTYVHAKGHLPFAIGDVNPGGLFIHVFDHVSIKRILTELDTITDFTRYLNDRAEYLRSGHLLMAHGEEELLARYLMVGMETGKRDFEHPKLKRMRKKDRKGKTIVNTTIQGEWAYYIFSDGYLGKTLANRNSYAWDKLIREFTKNIIAGTSVSMFGETPQADLAEPALRIMAQETRFARRVLGEAFVGTIRDSLDRRLDRFVRVVTPGSINPKVAYIFMILAYTKDLEESGVVPDYDKYRRVRVNMLEAYCWNVLMDNRHLDTAVGIAMDASSLHTGRAPGGSEDLMAVHVDEWSNAMIDHAKELRERFDVLRKGRLEQFGGRQYEYPRLGPNTVHRRPYASSL